VSATKTRTAKETKMSYGKKERLAHAEMHRVRGEAIKALPDPEPYVVDDLDPYVMREFQARHFDRFLTRTEAARDRKARFVRLVRELGRPEAKAVFAAVAK